MRVRVHFTVELGIPMCIDVEDADSEEEAWSLVNDDLYNRMGRHLDGEEQCEEAQTAISMEEIQAMAVEKVKDNPGLVRLSKGSSGTRLDTTEVMAE